MNSVPQISVSSTRVQRKCVGGGGGDGHFFSLRKAFWRKRHFNCPLKSKQRRAFRGLRWAGTEGWESPQEKGEDPLRKDLQMVTVTRKTQSYCFLKNLVLES